MSENVKKYLSEIGRRGGRRSRRSLSTQDAREMVRVREARRAYKRYWVQCFWSFDKEYVITKADIPWVALQLKKYGNREAYQKGINLCR